MLPSILAIKITLHIAATHLPSRLYIDPLCPWFLHSDSLEFSPYMLFDPWAHTDVKRRLLPHPTLNAIHRTLYPSAL